MIRTILPMEKSKCFDYLLRILGEGMNVRTSPSNDGLSVHVVNRNQEKSIDFKATDENDAKEKAVEWMLGQMLYNYDGFASLVIFLAGRENSIREMRYGGC